MYKIFARILDTFNLGQKVTAEKVTDYISKFSDQKIAAEIIPLIKELPPAERAQVLEALDENGFIDKQISVIMANGSVEKKIKAIGVLVTVGHAKGFLAMIVAMKDHREEVKWALTEAIKKCQSPSLVIPKLIEALKNPNLWPPARIAEICISFGDEAIPYLIKELKNDSYDQKATIIEIIGELKSETALKELRKHTEYLQDNEELFATVIEAFGKVRSDIGLELILKALKSSHSKLKIAAINALAKQEKRDYGKYLLPILVSEESLTRMKAAQALKALGWEIATEQIKIIASKNYNLADLNKVLNLIKDANLVRQVDINE